MKYRIVIIITALLCSMAIATVWGETDADSYESFADISCSAVHFDSDIDSFRFATEIEPREIPTITSRNEAGTTAEYIEPTVWVLSRETIINIAYELYGVSEEWTMWLIGTTWNEGYQSDRYLEYAWACEILNCYRDWSVWDLDCIWGDYYSIGHAYDGYYAADDTTLEMIWYALTDRDTRIVEVDGMIRWDVPGYYLIYDSEIYNCQVWGE